MITVFCIVGIVYFIGASYHIYIDIERGKSSAIIQDSLLEIHQMNATRNSEQFIKRLFDSCLDQMLYDQDEFIKDLKDMKHLQLKKDLKDLQEELHGANS